MKVNEQFLAKHTKERFKKTLLRIISYQTSQNYAKRAYLSKKVVKRLIFENPEVLKKSTSMIHNC